MSRIIVLCILATPTLMTFRSTKELSPVEYIFNITSKQVEQTVISIFKAFELPFHIVNSRLMKKESKLYTYLKGTVDFNFKTFTDIATHFTIKRNSNKSVIHRILDEILNGSLNCTNAKTAILKEFAQYIPLIIQNTEPGDPYDLSLEFISDFLNKLNSLSVDDIIGTNQTLVKKTRRYSKKRRRTRMKGHEIQVWHGPNVQNAAINDKQFVKINNTRRFHKNPRYDARRLYQGKKASITNYPFMVSVHANKEFVCAGCIIRSELVISAASCLQRVYDGADSAQFVTIRVGSNYAYSGGFVIVVSHAIFHPSYNSTHLRNNLVLLNVPKGAFSRLPWIKRIKYQQVADTVTSVKVLGWGQQEAESRKSAIRIVMKAKFVRTSNITKAPNIDIPLSIDTLDLYTIEECRNIYTKAYITKNNACAGFLLSGNGACKYDIGGPGIHNGILLGIISFGPERCGLKDKPTVFTKITPYLKWIHKVLHVDLPKFKPMTNNETSIKTRKQNSLYLANRPRTLINYRKVMNIIKPLKTKTTPDIREADQVTMNNGSIDNVALSYYSCLFDNTCDLSIEYMYDKDDKDSKDLRINEASNVFNINDLKPKLRAINSDIQIKASFLNNVKIIKNTSRQMLHRYVPKLSNEALEFIISIENSSSRSPIEWNSKSKYKIGKENINSPLFEFKNKKHKPIQTKNQDISDTPAAVFWKQKFKSLKSLKMSKNISGHTMKSKLKRRLSRIRQRLQKKRKQNRYKKGNVGWYLVTEN